MRFRHQEPEPLGNADQFAPSAGAPSRLDTYLGEVERHLGARVSTAQRGEIRRELASHLEALVDAYVELGHSPDEALDAALQQFGKARQVGRAYRAAGADGSEHGASLVTAPMFLLALLFFAPVTLAVGEVFGIRSLGTLLCGPALPILLGVHWSRQLAFGQRGWSPLLGVVFISVLTSLAVPTPGYFDSYLLFHGMWATAQLCMWLILACAAAGLVSSGRELLNRWRRAHAA